MKEITFSLPVYVEGGLSEDMQGQPMKIKRSGAHAYQDLSRDEDIPEETKKRVQVGYVKD